MTGENWFEITYAIHGNKEKTIPLHGAALCEIGRAISADDDKLLCALLRCYEAGYVCGYAQGAKDEAKYYSSEFT